MNQSDLIHDLALNIWRDIQSQIDPTNCVKVEDIQLIIANWLLDHNGEIYVADAENNDES